MGSANLVVSNLFPLAAVAIVINVVVSVVVVIIVVCYVIFLVKRKKTTANRAADVEIPMSTTTASASRTTQPGVAEEPHHPAENPFSSVAYTSSPRNLPPPDYPYPLEPPPPYPGKEGGPQYPPPGQPYPWQQSSGNAPITESP